MLSHSRKADLEKRHVDKINTEMKGNRSVENSLISQVAM